MEVVSMVRRTCGAAAVVALLAAITMSSTATAIDQCSKLDPYEEQAKCTPGQRAKANASTGVKQFKDQTKAPGKCSVGDVRKPDGTCTAKDRVNGSKADAKGGLEKAKTKTKGGVRKLRGDCTEDDIVPC